MPATVSIQVITDLPEVGDRFIAAGMELPDIIEANFFAGAENIRDAVDLSVRAETPVGETGDLRDSTETEFTPLGAGFDVSAEITSRQPLEVHSNRADWILAQLIIEGYDTGEIVPIMPGGALMWPGLAHPVPRSAGHSRPGDDYGEAALLAIMPVVDAEIEEAGLASLEEVWSTI